MKSKVIHVQVPAPKQEKTKKWEKFSGLQNGGIRGLQIGPGFRDYKPGQEGLQTDNFSDFKSGQKDYKSWQRDFKSAQGLQIGAEHMLISQSM